MAKGWKLVATSDMSYGDQTTTAQKKRNEAGMRNLIRNTATVKKEEVLKKEGEVAADEKLAYNSQLKAAYADKKLKSKRLIKKAQRLRKQDKVAADE